jgi:hypothetical protein
MSKVKGITTRQAEILARKEDLLDELRAIDAQLQKLAIVPETFIGRCFRLENYNDCTEFSKITDVIKGDFVVQRVYYPKHLRPNRDNTYPRMSIEYISPGSFFYTDDIEDIAVTDFQAAVGQFMALLPR